MIGDLRDELLPGVAFEAQLTALRSVGVHVFRRGQILGVIIVGDVVRLDRLLGKDNLTLQEHPLDELHVGDVFRGVLVQQDQIRFHAFPDLSLPVGNTEVLRAVLGREHDRLHRRKPGLHVIRELLVLDVAAHGLEHIVRAHGDRDARVIEHLEVVYAVPHAGGLLLIGHGVDGRNKTRARFLPEPDNIVARLNVPVDDPVLDSVDAGLKQLFDVVVVKNVRRRVQTVFFALADDLPHQRGIDFLNRQQIVEIPEISALIGEFQKIHARFFQLPDPRGDLLRRGDLERHLGSRPGVVTAERIGGMTVGRREVRPDQQQLGARDFTGGELLAKLVDEMLRRVKILDRCDPVGQDLVAEDLRKRLVEKTVALLFAAVVQAALDMDMAVDQAGHQRFTLALDDLHVFPADRLI